MPIKKLRNGKLQVQDKNKVNRGTFTDLRGAEKREQQVNKELLPNAKKKLRPATKKRH